MMTWIRRRPSEVALVVALIAIFALILAIGATPMTGDELRPQFTEWSL